MRHSGQLKPTAFQPSQFLLVLVTLPYHSFSISAKICRTLSETSGCALFRLADHPDHSQIFKRSYTHLGTDLNLVLLVLFPSPPFLYNKQTAVIDDHYALNNGVPSRSIQGHVSILEEDFTCDPPFALHCHPPISWWRYHHQPSIHRQTLPGHEQGFGGSELSYPHRHLHQSCHWRWHGKVSAGEKAAHIGREKGQC